MNVLTKLQRQRRKKKLESVYHALAGESAKIELHALLYTHGELDVPRSQFRNTITPTHLGCPVLLSESTSTPTLTLTAPTASGDVIQVVGFLMALHENSVRVLIHPSAPITIA